MRTGGDEWLACCPVLSDAASLADTSGFFNAEPDSAATWRTLICREFCIQ